MKDVGIFYGHLVHFTAISYILWPFGVFCGHFGVFCGHFDIFFPILVCRTKKNLATLLRMAGSVKKIISHGG
jgi:hypothetical protein